ncbi:hypothetical protein [Martelella sp. HB161492]|uniref:hypothetical protein n=1 Tax=Martelella sp. HB161492 TaxID=2720726 RepID=UPI0015908B06|nr:hypothetical protein [Martelella sp. HB161492]
MHNSDHIETVKFAVFGSAALQLATGRPDDLARDGHLPALTRRYGIDFASAQRVTRNRDRFGADAAGHDEGFPPAACTIAAHTISRALPRVQKDARCSAVPTRAGYAAAAILPGVDRVKAKHVADTARTVLTAGRTVDAVGLSNRRDPGAFAPGAAGTNTRHSGLSGGNADAGFRAAFLPASKHLPEEPFHQVLDAVLTHACNRSSRLIASDPLTALIGPDTAITMPGELVATTDKNQGGATAEMGTKS